MLRAIDGILLRTITPPKTSVGYVKSFSSSHYYVYGLNVLAACDHQCRFLYVTCQAPGGSNDITAYRNSTLPSYVEGLPISRFIVGDNAYVPAEHLLTPFSGNDRLDPSFDANNYYLSQIRIRIEMSFGRLVNKFKIFKSPLQCSLKSALGTCRR